VALRTSAAVVAQVWRDGATQARLNSLLRAVLEVPLDGRRARTIGGMLARVDTTTSATARSSTSARTVTSW